MVSKKILAFALCAIMPLSFSACGKENVDDSIYTIRSTQSEYSVSLLNDEVKTSKMQIEMTKNGESFAPSGVFYTSENSAVATIDQNGIITAVAPGETKVSASFGSGEKTVSVASDVVVYNPSSTENINTYSESHVNLYGRTYIENQKLVLDNAATGVEVAFYGTELKLNVYLSGRGGNLAKLRCFIDGEEDGSATILEGLSTKKPTEYIAASSLEYGIHTARIVKASSPQYGAIGIDSLTTNGTFLDAKEKSNLKIEFIGDSITAGFGAVGSPSDEGNVTSSDCTKSYAYLTAQALDADYDIIALEGICAKDGSPNMYERYEKVSVCNANTAFAPSSFEADYVVVALGENDTWHASSPLFSYTMKQLKEDYADLLRLIRKHHPNSPIICLYGMMGASDNYMDLIYNSAVKNFADDNIGNLPVQPNTTGGGAHPNAASHKSYAQRLTDYILTL